MGSHSVLQGIFLTQELNLSLQHYRQILYYLSHMEAMSGLRCVSTFQQVDRVIYK